MAVLDELERAEGFTATERLLAKFILEHADDVVQMSITCLAEQTFSSNASIVRLCHKLGADGYRDFRIKLAADLEKRRVARVRVDADRPFTEGGGAPDVMSSLAALLKQAIDESYASVSPRDVEQAARLMRSARHVYVFASGDSQISAMALENMLIKLGVHVVIADRYGDAFSVAAAAMPGDAALFVSYSGKLVAGDIMRRTVGILAERQCHTIWISSAEKPFGFDVALRFPHRETKSGKIATFYSQMCIRYLLNCLYGAIWELDYEGNADRKAALDDIDIMLTALYELGTRDS